MTRLWEVVHFSFPFLVHFCIPVDTKGYVVAEMGSLNQLLTFQSPSSAAVHEFYHMLGCDHDDDSKAIANKIERLKRLALRNKQLGRDFFPGIGSKDEILLTRRDVEARFGLAKAQTTEKDQAAATDSKKEKVAGK